MGSGAPCRVSVGLYEFLWNLWGLWVPMGSLWDLWSLWVPVGSLWVSVGSTGLDGIYGVCMVSVGFLWVSVGSVGSLWDIYGSLWVSVGSMGFLWVSLCFYGLYSSLWDLWLLLGFL